MKPIDSVTTHPKSFTDKLVHATSRGIACALLSTALFVVVGVLVRLVGERIDLFQVLLARQVVFIACLAPAMWVSWQVLLRPQAAGLHALRILGAFLALYLGFVTLQHMPLADAVALGFSQLLFVGVLAKLVLAEPINGGRVLTLVAGFIGVLLVVQPSFAGAQARYVALGLVAAFGAALAVICVRVLVQRQAKIVLLSYQAIFVALIALGPSLYRWCWPNFDEAVLLLAIGVLSSLAQWLGVSAYKLAQANVVANLEYAKMLYSVLLGYYLFAEVPNTLALVGASLILISPLMALVWRVLSKSGQA
ncbi:MAG: DMT family transporter [Pseudomonadales bacterium]